MGMPSNIGYGRVVGRLIRAVLDGQDVNETPDGVPIPDAQVTFTADVTHARNRHADPPVTIFFDPVVVETDSDGMIATRDGQVGVWLVATDDADIDPMIGAYVVTVTAPSIPRLLWRIAVPEGETVDLATAIPVPDSPAADIAEWVRVRGDVIQARDETVAVASEVAQFVVQAEAAASEAGSSATSASSSASTASTKAVEASTSASSAATSASSAASARDEAEAARDEAEAARDETLAAAGGGGTGAVTSVNGQTGAVSLGAADVGADPAGTAAGLVGALMIPDSPDDIGAASAAHTHAPEDVTGTAVITTDARLSDARTPLAHSHTLADVTDAGDAAGLDVGTTAGTVMAGDDSRVTSLSSTYVAQANLTVTPGASVSGSNTGDQTLPTWTTLAGKPAVVAAGATQADARTAIGAGTSNLTIGTTSTTAKAGNYTPPDASTTVKGIVELATNTEATTGTDTTRAVTPAGVAAAISGVGGGVTDHGALSGLADDDHTQYALADGSRGAFAPPLGADDNYVTDAEKAALHSHSNKTALDAVSGTNTGDQDLSGYALSTQAINAQTGTTYTLVASDASKLVTCTNSGAITVTVPASTFAAGQRVDLLVLGAGMVTVAAGSGMTLNGTPSLVSRAQYSALTVLLLSATSAVVVGDFATP